MPPPYCARAGVSQTKENPFIIFPLYQLNNQVQGTKNGAARPSREKGGVVYREYHLKVWKL